jgi:hypothetical protein
MPGIQGGHVQRDTAIVQHLSPVQSVRCFKPELRTGQAQRCGKLDCTASPVAAKAAQATVCVEIKHRKCGVDRAPIATPIGATDQDEAVSPNAKMPVAKGLDQFLLIYRKNSIPVINQHKVVAGTVVFLKADRHGGGR